MRPGAHRAPGGPRRSDSSSIHAHFRLPTLGPKATQTLLDWAADALDAEERTGDQHVTGASLRETCRRNRSHSAPAPARQRRRGVRRWAPVPTGAGPGASTPEPGVPDRPLPGGPATPTVVVDLVRWLLQSVEQVVVAGLGGRDAEPPASPPAEAGMWRAWLRAGPSELGAIVLRNPMLRSLLAYTVVLAQQLTALSSRNETLRWLYTSVVWYLTGRWAARAYLQHLVLPSLLASPVTGIPGIAQTIIHREVRPGREGPEWYASTEGSTLGHGPAGTIPWHGGHAPRRLTARVGRRSGQGRPTRARTIGSCPRQQPHRPVRGHGAVRGPPAGHEARH